MNTQLAVRSTVNLNELTGIARILALSGFFGAQGAPEVREAQAATKILAGAELGFGPFASINGVHIIQGKPVLAAGLLAAAVKSSGKYDYRIRENTNAKVSIEFYQAAGREWESLGISTFTAEDAKAANLSGKDNWKNFPRNMLFSRAMSNGVRWYTPDVFAGNIVYTAEELGAEVDGETGEIVDVTPRVLPANGHKPEVHAEELFQSTNGHDVDMMSGIESSLLRLHANSTKGPASEKAYGYLVSLIDGLTAKGAHTFILEGITGRNISKENPTSAEMTMQLINWLAKEKKQGEERIPNPDYRQEVADWIINLWVEMPEPVA